MTDAIRLGVPLNRVEGDLEVRAELRDGVVTDAWCAGTMFRGIERVLVGRAPLDALVVTPRVCGMCSTAHLTAAARALEALAGVTPPPDAVRVRNVALAAELAQSDLRHALLLFAVDFARPAHRRHPLFDEAVRRYLPFRGEAVVGAVRASKRVVEIVAILGGQWPHSSYMVPGGIVSRPSASDLRQCRMLLAQHRAYYEERILGCRIERWREVDSADALDAWLAESAAHRDGELGFFVRFARAAGLDRYGAAHARFLSVGAFESPAAEGGPLLPAGVAHAGTVAPFDEAAVTEHVSHSWYEASGPAHPHNGATRPYATGAEARAYSWAKAPRHDGLPAETGPLAELVVAGDPLATDLVRRHGDSVLVRQLARLVRQARLVPAMEEWLADIGPDEAFYANPGPLPDGTGVGLVEAARGALGHWVRVEDGRIAGYQIVTPTTWNASPRDDASVRGPMEEALVGTPVADPDDPVELGHVARSFDPCLVCTVHAVEGGRTRGVARTGGPA